MSNRRLGACLLVSVLVVTLTILGCANFPPRRATELPPPIDTPLPVVVEPISTATPLPPPPTDTPTPVVVAAVSTPTSTLEPTTEPEPTDTPQVPATATPTSLPPSPTPIPEPTELLANGGFEEGFGADGVAAGWHKFSNGNGAFGWTDDTWELVVWEGEHSQLLSLIDPSLNDRYMGIYQTVDVVPGNAYELTLHGLVRSNTPPEQYGHRLYWGVDYDGGTDWQGVEQWEELPWDEQPRVAKAFTINAYSTVITPTGQSLTFFIRGHSKWQRYSEANFNLDGLSLKGVPGAAPGDQPGMPVTGRREIDWVPIVALIFLVLILVREVWHGVNGLRDEV